MSVLTFNDDIIKIKYNPRSIYQYEDVIKIGVTTENVGRLDFTPDDNNSIFVSKSGNDTTGTGTQSNPVKSISKAITVCTSTKTHIIILDDGVYEEQDLNLTSNVSGIYSIEGKVPEIKPIYNPTTQLIDDINNLTALTQINQSIAGYEYRKSVQLSDGNIVVLVRYYSSGAYHYYYYVYNKDDCTVLKGLTLIKSLDIAFLGLDIIADSDSGFIVVYSKRSNDHLWFEVHGIRFYGYSYNYSIRSSGMITRVKPEPTIVVASYEMALCNLSNGNYGAFAIVRTYYSFGGISLHIAIGLSFHFTDSLLMVSGTNAEVFTLQNIPFETYYTHLKICGLDNNYTAMTWRNGYTSTSYYAVFNNAAAIKSATSLGNITLIDLKPIRHSTNKFVLLCSTLSTAHYIKLFNSSGSVLINTQYSSRNLSSPRVVVDSTSAFNILATDSNLGTTWLVVNRFDFDGTRMGTEQVHQIYSLFKVNSYDCIYDNEDTGIGQTIFIGYYNNYLYQILITGYVWPAFVLNGNVEFNGLKITGTQLGLKYLFYGTGNLLFKYCTVMARNYLDNGLLQMQLGKTTGSISASNSIFYNSNKGFVLSDCTSIQLSRCLFYKIYYEYAIKADNVSDTLSVINTTFFNNYGALYLTNNTAPSIIIKNNIFHNNAVHDIYSDSDITLVYSVYTGVLVGVIIGTNVINSNPLFVNEGTIDINDTDLHIRTKKSGFTITSPAHGLGDDGNDAGAYLIHYAIVEEIRDEITLPVPYVEQSIIPVGSEFIVTNDGSVSSSVNGFYVQLEFTWKGLLNVDYEKILLLLQCKKSDVNIYHEPKSKPTSYINGRLKYDVIPATNLIPKHYEVGIRDAKLIFMTGI